MKIDILTLFPNSFPGPLDESMMRIAREKNLVEINIVNIRDFSRDKHKKVDDRPFGGGPGMVMKPEPVFECVESIRAEESRIILMTPQGRLLSQKLAKELSRETHLIVICGSYEEVDQRIRDALVDDEISIGDYVLTNGALPAMVLSDCVVRLIPGVLGDAESAHSESFTENLLDYPHYTRPEVFRGMHVPDILLSGNHQMIEEWRRQKALEKTRLTRPDLLEKGKNESDLNSKRTDNKGDGQQ